MAKKNIKNLTINKANGFRLWTRGRFPLTPPKKKKKKKKLTISILKELHPILHPDS